MLCESWPSWEPHSVTAVVLSPSRFLPSPEVDGAAIERPIVTVSDGQSRKYVAEGLLNRSGPRVRLSGGGPRGVAGLGGGRLWLPSGTFYI